METRRAGCNGQCQAGQAKARQDKIRPGNAQQRVAATMKEIMHTLLPISIRFLQLATKLFFSCLCFCSFGHMEQKKRSPPFSGLFEPPFFSSYTCIQSLHSIALLVEFIMFIIIVLFSISLFFWSFGFSLLVLVFDFFLVEFVDIRCA